MTEPLETFLQNLEKSGILAGKTLTDFIPPNAAQKGVDEFVAELIRQKKLTKFQADRISQGKGKSLVLGNYILLDKIGQGGMGQVYQARHRRMDRQVAVKLLPPALAKDEAAIARFEREVKAAAKLRHPNIVAADDADEADGVHFLVMEYVEGKDLSATVKLGGPLPVNRAVNYLLQAARGLQFAHAQGVVHRDIKPANLLVDIRGVVKILDMGLARIEQADGAAQSELTSSGMIMGTVDYMAPEQAINTKRADHRSDIYSLGISLYFLLSGKAAYSGETAIEKLMAHQNQSIPSLKAVRESVPDQLDAVFRKMVAKKAEDRYQSMTEVIGALERLGLNEAITTADNDAATAMALSLSDDEPTRICFGARKKPLETQTKVVGLNKSRRWTAMIAGPALAAVFVLILVPYLIKYFQKQEEPAAATSKGALAADAVGTGEAAAVTANPPPSVAPAPLIAPFDAARAKAGQAAWAKHLRTQVETINSVGMTMILIPPGEFLMGSPEARPVEESKTDPKTKDYSEPNERPQHRVVITQPFLMGRTEVTIGQFRKFAETTGYKTDSERFQTDPPDKRRRDLPPDWNATYLTDLYHGATDDSAAQHLTWHDAAAFCLWLSKAEQFEAPYEVNTGRYIESTGQGYHLPTEAQWEYACRAGTTTTCWFGDDLTRLEEFAHSAPNPFGLRGLYGSKWEWCQDWYDEKWYAKSPGVDPVGPLSGVNRVQRGGLWAPQERFGRSAARNSQLPTALIYYGFRVGRAWPAAGPAKPTPPAVASVEPESSPEPPAPLVAPFDPSRARSRQVAWAKHLQTQVKTTNSVGITMVLIPPGEFRMGSSAAGPMEFIQPNERPQHRVVITQPFLMGQTEVTIGQFKKFGAATGYQSDAEKAELIPEEKRIVKWGGTYLSPLRQGFTDDFPAMHLSWQDAVAFCLWLSQEEKLEAPYEETTGKLMLSTGKGYHLPTEAQWEYACRAGTITTCWFGDDLTRLDDYARIENLTDVGSTPPNPFGLQDMYGSVWEWSQDWYDEEWYAKSPAIDPVGPPSGVRRVQRGGVWAPKEQFCRSASRHSESPMEILYHYGFRIVRTW